MATRGLREAKDCEAQWIHGGPENTRPIRHSWTNIPIVNELLG
jgi:hypothetical protein